VAALLLVSRSVCEEHGLPAPDLLQIFSATKATRSAAYLLCHTLLELLPTLARPRGRPPKPPSDSALDSEIAELGRAVLGYVMRHPGCVHKTQQRQHYSDDFRHFLLEQRTAFAALDLERFAATVQVPLGTLKDWLRDWPAAARPVQPASAPTEQRASEPLHIETVLQAWPGWHGSFRDFCDHVRDHLLIPMGRGLIAHILFAHGARRPNRRQGRSSDESALRDAFTTYFPGAQWVGDGMQLGVVIDGQRFHVNFELAVDAHTDAMVGTSVRQEEDATAVVESIDSGVQTTGARPLAVLLDNKPSNHAPQVVEALDDTVLIRATVERPQNKAHVEGAFGLFSRVLPELTLDTRNGPGELALSLVRIVTRVWAQTLNHRPRNDRGGLSRIQLYGATPSAEQIDEARKMLRLLCKRQELARRTLEQRRRPEVLALLLDHFTTLGLLDPDSHILVAIAGYPLDCILAGIAIFDGKLRAKTLPDGADARYLLGIVRNRAAKSEAEQMARALLELRLEVTDRMLAPLCAQRDALFSGTDLAGLVAGCIDRALGNQGPLVRIFWLDALASRLAGCAVGDKRDHFLAAARRINATFAIPPRQRADAVCILAERLVPLR
jgi:hypothetical protein